MLMNLDMLLDFFTRIQDMIATNLLSLTQKTSRIQQGRLIDFEQETMATNNNYDLPYDFDSIMHYGSTVSSLARIRWRLAGFRPQGVNLAHSLRNLAQTDVPRAQYWKIKVDELHISIAKEVIEMDEDEHEDIIAEARNDGNVRKKRQAFRDSRYPKTVWKNKRVAFFFDNSTSEKAKSAFRKAAQAWRDNTCIDIYEDTCGNLTVPHAS
ncbi:unnamed protein product [Heligmosomoides polygyrus]|uniref:Peptidase M12A domain-containing protein n=1 Tax=Heligmosomoides polygyrus TaxID=6339 RepID=A0A3P8A5M6_HELPZ|nr:unnamed protein product [Heligmosomoides polygyrus]